MCLAIYCPKKSDKNSDFLFKAIDTASKTNDDGMGFAFKRGSTKKVYLSKGYTNVTHFIDAIKARKLGDNDELIVHLRIGNKGLVNGNMCHPFVASKDQEEVLSNDKYVDNPVFIHNGTLTKYSKWNDDYSDTYYFAKDFASYTAVMNVLKQDKEAFKEIFSEHIGTSRFAFLFPNESTDGILLGDFKEDNGYYFSNESYKNSRIRNVGGFEYDWDDYYNGYQKYSGYGSRSNYTSSVYDTKPSVNDDEDDDSCIVTTIDYSKKTIFQIPDDFCTDAYSDPMSGVKYRYYMGLWIPNGGYGEIRIDPNGLNYKTLLLESRADLQDIDVVRKCLFDIMIFDETTYKENKLHSILRKGAPHTSQTYIFHNELVTKFLILPKLNYSTFYETYISFVKNQTHSKNNLKRISKKLNSIGKDEFYIKGFGNITKDVLELYQYNLVKHLSVNDDEFKELYHKYCFD